MATPEYKTFHPLTRRAWRKWLAQYHDREPGVWFVYYKKESGKPRVAYAEAVEEALCFGWIDSLPRKLDEERSMLKFSPRKPRSAWSQSNKERVVKLIEKNLMTPSGKLKIDQARMDGSWELLTASDNHTANNTLPADLEKALSRNRKARDIFNALAPGYRKQFLFWIDSAKLPETRKNRIRQTVKMAAANKKPGTQG